MSSFHGTVGGYTNHRCRCEPCRAAWAKYHRRYRAKTSTRTRKVREVVVPLNDATPAEREGPVTESPKRPPDR